MKKIISLTLALFVVGVIALQGKMGGMLIHEKAVTKTVAFSIFIDSPYSLPLYKNSNANVVLTVYKLNGNNNVVLWNTVIDKRKLNKYPLLGKCIYRKLTFFNIKERSENLVASYKITYNTKGSQFSYEKNYLIEHATGSVVPVAL